MKHGYILDWSEDGYLIANKGSKPGNLVGIPFAAVRPEFLEKFQNGDLFIYSPWHFKALPFSIRQSDDTWELRIEGPSAYEDVFASFEEAMIVAKRESYNYPWLGNA